MSWQVRAVAQWLCVVRLLMVDVTFDFQALLLPCLWEWLTLTTSSTMLLESFESASNARVEVQACLKTSSCGRQVQVQALLLSAEAL